MPKKAVNTDKIEISSSTKEEASYEFNTTLPIGFLGNWNEAIGHFDSARLAAALETPQYDGNNRFLREMCWWAYNSNGVIRSSVDYLASLSTLSSVIYSRSINRNGNKPPGYERNKRIFSQVLDRIKHKQVIRDVIRKQCNDGIAFYYFVVNHTSPMERMIDPLAVATLTEINADEGEVEINNAPNCDLFPLPTSYCKIVGKRNGSFTVAFDLYYFNTFVGNNLKRKLRQYPPEISSAWKKYSMGAAQGHRWIVLDETKTLVVKTGSKDESVWGVPVVAATLSDKLFVDHLLNTKRDMLDTVNNRVLYMEFPQGRDPGTCSLAADQQISQHNTVKAALQNRTPGRWGLSFFSVAPGTKINSLDVETGILDMKNEAGLRGHISEDIGLSEGLIGGDSNGNYAILKLNLELATSRVFEWINVFAAELNKVINSNIIRQNGLYMEVDYLPISHVNRDEMYNRAKDLFLIAGGSYQALVESAGFSFDGYIAMVESEGELDLKSLFIPHITSYTISDRSPNIDEADQVGGRPRDESSDNDATIASRNNGGDQNPRADV